jgi:acyl-CoA thioesterase-2
MLERLLAAFTLTETDAATLRGAHVHEGSGQPVFGGELLGQAIVAAGRSMPGKRVKSVQTIFARAAMASEPVDIRVEPMHEGRSFGSATITFSQGERLCARSLVLVDVAEPDLVRHQPQMPAVPTPDAGAAVVLPAAGPEAIVVGDVDVADAAQVGPPTLQLWVRFQGAPSDDPNLARALLAFATDGWLIGTAMRPHAGIGQSMAHREISTSVLTQALVFHDDVDVNEWHLLDHQSVFAGGGRCYGRANVSTEGGALAASFTQEALLRHMSEAKQPADASRAAL